MNPSAGTVQGQGANQGWRRSGDAASQQPASQQPSVQPQNPQGGFSQRGGSSGTATHEWSRFGEPIHGSVPDSSGRMRQAQTYSGTNGSYGRGVDRASYSQSQTDSGSSSAAGWHRFGQPSGAGSIYQSTPQSSGQRSYYDNGNTRRFGGASNYQSAPQTSYQQPYSQPSQQYSAPRDYGRGSNSQPVRISPPMVRERPAPSVDNSRGGSSGYRSFGGGGGGGSRNVQSSSGGGSHQSSGGGNNHSSGSNNNGGGHSGGRR